MKQLNNQNGNGGIGVLGLMGIVFVTLKLINVIDWSWWWVTIPFWGGAALVGIILFMWFILALIGTLR